VLDRRRGSVFLARDRMGIKPLHFAIDGRRLVFASELKALLCDPALRREIDPVALDQYLAYEFVPSPRSIVLGINKLQPAHTLTWSVAESSKVDDATGGKPYGIGYLPVTKIRSRLWMPALCTRIGYRCKPE